MIKLTRKNLIIRCDFGNMLSDLLPRNWLVVNSFDYKYLGITKHEKLLCKFNISEYGIDWIENKLRNYPDILRAVNEAKIYALDFENRFALADKISKIIRDHCSKVENEIIFKSLTERNTDEND